VNEPLCRAAPRRCRGKFRTKSREPCALTPRSTGPAAPATTLTARSPARCTSLQRRPRDLPRSADRSKPLRASSAWHLTRYNAWYDVRTDAAPTAARNAEAVNHQADPHLFTPAHSRTAWPSTACPVNPLPRSPRTTWPTGRTRGPAQPPRDRGRPGCERERNQLPALGARRPTIVCRGQSERLLSKHVSHESPARRRVAWCIPVRMPGR